MAEKNFLRGKLWGEEKEEGLPMREESVRKRGASKINLKREQGGDS